jgi:hypothetical protein
VPLIGVNNYSSETTYDGSEIKINWFEIKWDGFEIKWDDFEIKWDDFEIKWAAFLHYFLGKIRFPPFWPFVFFANSFTVSDEDHGEFVSGKQPFDVVTTQIYVIIIL